MIRCSRVLEKNIPGNVTRKGTTYGRVNILISIIVKVSERDRMALLKMPESTGGRDILKSFPAVISKHAIWNDGSNVRIPCGQVKIEPTVIVQITEITSHRMKNMIETGLFCHI